MFLPSGQVHALGAGMVIFEIQQNSGYDLPAFDLGIVPDWIGKPRELHANQSLESIDFFDFRTWRPCARTELPGSKTVRSLLRDELFSVDLAVLPHRRSTATAFGDHVVIIGVVRGESGVRYASGNLTSSLLPVLPDP